MNQVKFGFDARDFTKGIQQVVNDYAKMEKNILSAGKMIGKSIESNAKKMMDWAGVTKKNQKSIIGSVKGFFAPKSVGKSDSPAESFSMQKEKGGGFPGGALGKAGAIGSVFTGIKSAIDLAVGGARTLVSVFSQIPEVGETFRIVGDIFKKNLLQPLRAELLPYLQRVLDWTSANRARFVQWGNLLASAFRVFMVAGKIAFSVVQKLADGFFKGISRAFGIASKGIEDTIQVLLLRMTAIFIFLEPYINKIAGVVSGLLEMMGIFVNKFIKAFVDSEFMKTFIGFFETLGGIYSRLKEIFGLKEDMGGFVKVVEYLATVFGKLVAFNLTILTTQLRSIINLVKDLLNLDFKKAGIDLVGIFTGVDKSGIKAGVDLAKALAGKSGKVAPAQQDAIVKADGTIIPISSEDNVIATKNKLSVGGASGVTIQNVIGSMSVTVTEGNAQRAGENFADSLGKRLRMVLQGEMQGAGY